jgi:hypothetical protein
MMMSRNRLGRRSGLGFFIGIDPQVLSNKKDDHAIFEIDNLPGTQMHFTCCTRLEEGRNEPRRRS